MEDIILNDPWLNLTYEKKKKSNILIVMAWKLSSIWIYSESFRENKGVGRLYLKLRDFRKVIFEHPTARPESSDDTPWLARDFRVRHYAINLPSDPLLRWQLDGIWKTRQLCQAKISTMADTKATWPIRNFLLKER